MNSKFFLILAIVPIVFLSGCCFLNIGNCPPNGGSLPSGQPVIPPPSINLNVNPNSVNVKTSQTSGIVTVTITKTDNYKNPTSFTIKLDSSNSTYFNPIAVAGSAIPTTEFNTKPLIDKGSSDIIQFKVLGQLPSGTSETKGSITIQTYYNNEPIGDQAKLSVTVTQ